MIFNEPTKKIEIAANELTTIAKGAGVNFLGKITGGIIQYLSLIILARLLGVSTFGLFVLGVTVIEFVAVFGRLGLDGAVVKFVSLYNAVHDNSRTKGTIIEALKYSFLSGTILASVLWILPKLLYTNLFNKPGLPETIKILAFSLPFSALLIVALNSTQGFKTMSYTVFGQNLFNPAVNLLLFIIFFLAGFKLYGAVAAYILAAFFTAILSLYFLIKIFPPIRTSASISETGKLFRFSIPFLGIMLMLALIQWTDVMLVGHFRTSYEVGIYNAAVKTALLLNTILLSFSHIFSPIISELYEKSEMEKLGHLFKIVTRWSFTISLPVFLIIVLLSKEIMELFGRDFAKACVPLIILASAQLVNAGTGPATHILIMAGKHNLMVINTAAICLINILLNYLLIPVHGIVGAAVASSTSIILFNTIMLAEILALLKMHPYDNKFFKPVSFGIITYLTFLLFRYFLPELNVTLKLILSIILLLAVYIGLMFAASLPAEDKIIVGIMKKKFSNLFF